MSRGFSPCVTFLLLVLTGGKALAVEPAPLITEQDIFDEVPMVLTVSRLSQPISAAPAAVTVIDRDMIRTTGARDLADVFRFVPGFYVGAFTSNDRVVGGGLNNRVFGRVQVLLDGKSVYTPIFGQVLWQALPVALEDIERIEVTRGPNAASYGSNSFLGIINIITRHPTQDQGGLLVASVGDPAVSDGLLRYGGKIGDLDYRFTLSHKEDNGFEARSDGQSTNTLTFRGDYRLDNRDTLQLQLGYTGGEFGAGYFDNVADPPRTQNVLSSYQQLLWRRAEGVDDEMSLQFYHTYNLTHDSFITPAFTSMGINVLPSYIQTDLDSERFDLEFQRNQRLAQAIRIAWGASARVDRVRAPLYFSFDEKFRTSYLQRAFLNAEWSPLESLIVNAGAVVEHNTIAKTHVSPRLAVSYHITPEHTLRIGVSEALRTPTTLEYNGSFSFRVNTTLGQLTVPQYFGNSNLRTERIRNREVAYLLNLSDLGLAADVRLYEEKVTGVIDSIGVNAVPFRFSVYQNAADVTLRGVQTQLQWRGKSTRFNLAYAYNKTVVDSALSVSEGNEIKLTNPNHILSMLFSQRLGAKVEASMAYYFLGVLEPIGDGDRLKASRRWDARLAYDFQLGSQRGTLALVGQNLFKPYSDYRTENLFTTRYLANVSLSF